jgi:hypothetical protein
MAATATAMATPKSHGRKSYETTKTTMTAATTTIPIHDYINGAFSNTSSTTTRTSTAPLRRQLDYNKHKTTIKR